MHAHQVLERTPLDVDQLYQHHVAVPMSCCCSVTSCVLKSRNEDQTSKIQNINIYTKVFPKRWIALSSVCQSVITEPAVH